MILFFREVVEDEVPLRYRMGDFGDALAFTSHSPEYREVELAVGLLNPISIEFHQVGDGNQSICVKRVMGAQCGIYLRLFSSA